MGSSDRKSRHREELRNLILESSMQIIREEGLGGFTIRQLAERIEYSPRTIYLYFRDKSAVLDAITERMFRLTLDELKRALASPFKAEDITGMMIERHIKNAISEPRLYEAVVGGINTIGRVPGEAEEELTIVIADILDSFLNPALKGRICEAAEIFLSSLRSTALLLIAKSAELTPDSTETYIDACKKILIGGLT